MNIEKAKAAFVRYLQCNSEEELDRLSGEDRTRDPDDWLSYDRAWQVWQMWNTHLSDHLFGNDNTTVDLRFDEERDGDKRLAEIVTLTIRKMNSPA